MMCNHSIFVNLYFCFSERGVEYEFHISGQNQVGFGQEATEYFNTPEGPPTGPPINVSYEFQTPDVVCVVWDEPSREHRNGQIIRYDVQFHKKIDQSTITHRNTTLKKVRQVSTLNTTHQQY